MGFSLEGVLKGFSRRFKCGWVYLKGFTHKFVMKVKDLRILKGLEGAQGSCMASWGMRQGLERGINMLLNIVLPPLKIRMPGELFEAALGSAPSTANEGLVLLRAEMDCAKPIEGGLDLLIPMGPRHNH